MIKGWMKNIGTASCAERKDRAGLGQRVWTGFQAG